MNAGTENPIWRNRKRLERVWGGLEQFAAECAVAGPPRTYVFAGWSLIARTFLYENPQLLEHVVGGNDPVTVDLPLSAREIYLRTDARIFGLDRAPHLTGKVLARRPVQPSLARERIARRVLAARLLGSPHIGVPALHAYGPGGGWLTETFVAGERADDSDVVSFVVDGAADDFFGATACLLPIGRRPLGRRLVRDLAALDSSYGETALDGALPYAVIHGDLLGSNLLRDRNGKFWAVDMGQARPAPVACDVASLYCAELSLLDPILQLLTRLSNSAETMRPERQLALGLAYEWRKRLTRGTRPSVALAVVKQALETLKARTNG